MKLLEKYQQQRAELAHINEAIAVAQSKTKSLVEQRTDLLATLTNGTDVLAEILENRGIGAGWNVSSAGRCTDGRVIGRNAVIDGQICLVEFDTEKNLLLLNKLPIEEYETVSY